MPQFEEHVAARVGRIDFVGRVTDADAALEQVRAGGVERVVVVSLEEAGLGLVLVGDEDARRVLRALRQLQIRRHARHADRRRVPDDRGRRRARRCPCSCRENMPPRTLSDDGPLSVSVDVAADVGLILVEAARDLRRIARQRAADEVAGRCRRRPSSVPVERSGV